MAIWGTSDAGASAPARVVGSAKEARRLASASADTSRRPQTLYVSYVRVDGEDVWIEEDVVQPDPRTDTPPCHRGRSNHVTAPTPRPDLDAILSRAGRAHHWCTTSPEPPHAPLEFVPLSVREHFERDMPALAAEAYYLRQENARLAAERDALLGRLWVRGEPATCRTCWHGSRYHHAGRCNAHDDDPSPKPPCICTHTDLWPTALIENGATP